MWPVHELAVILSEAKDLSFHLAANKCSFFAALRMTDFERSEAKDRQFDLTRVNADSLLYSE
jgi:hypothetical protein